LQTQTYFKMGEQYKVFLQTRRTTWEVSNHGNIKKNGNPYVAYKSGGHTGDQYPALSINAPHSGYIHRIVASEFINNPENKRTVNHKDGNKSNNHIDNLEWATYSENITHAYATGLKKGSSLGAEKRKEAYNLRLDGNSYNEIADILNISRNYVGVLIHKYKNNR